MPRKGGLVKTYGRHKFRTVKTSLWISPDDVFRSPLPKKERSFETPTTINRKSALATSTNLPRSHWNAPNKQPFATFPDGKENDQVQRKLKASKKSSQLSTGKKKATTVISLLSTDSSTTDEDLLVIDDHSNHQAVSRFKCEGNSGVIPETPPWVLNGQHYNDYSHGSSDECSIDVSVSSIQKPTNCKLTTNNGDHPLGLFPSPVISLGELSGQGNDSSLCSSGRKPLLYSTSTPVGRNNSTNSHYVANKGNLRLSDCQVLVQPMKLTPEQYQAARSSSGSLCEPQQDQASSTPANQTTEGHRYDTMAAKNAAINNYASMLKDCVVSLEKLKVSPFVSKEGRKRLRVSITTTPTSIKDQGDVSTPVFSPRKQASHVSFVEALTPLQADYMYARNKVEQKSVNVELNAYEKLLLECEQDGPMTFREYFKSSILKKCVKIGEGVYGEVFRTIDKHKQSVALKIIPINGDFEVNGEPQKSCEEILPEIIISKELSGLKQDSEELVVNFTPNFIDVHRVSLIQDKYPAHLIKEWKKWDKNNQSENDSPVNFPSDQYFLIFEFANGGQDLEHFEFESYSEAVSVIQQITASLAVAESSLEFEHRDLHWGNVLIVRDDQQEIDYCLNGEAFKFNSHGVHVSIIDFTLSRLTKDDVTVFCNLSEDESMFTGKGDYQFEIYRKMRQSNKDDWEAFTPETNVYWLHYLADKLLNTKKYPSHDKAMKGMLRKFLNQVREYQSAQEVIYGGFFPFV